MGPARKKKENIRKLKHYVQNVTTGRTTDCDSNKKGNLTSMQTSGWSLTMTFIRSSRGSKVRLSEGVYGPQATKTFTGSAVTQEECAHS